MQRGRGFGRREESNRVFSGGRGSFAARGRGSVRGRASSRLGEAGSKKTFADSSDDDHNVSSTVTSTAPKVESRPQIETIIRSDGTEFPAKLNNRVFIDGLPYNDPTEGPSIQTLLDQFVSEWKVGKMMSFLKRPGQGFGYLSFRSPHSVQTAVNVLNGRKFLGRALRVELPKPPKADRGEGDFAARQANAKVNTDRQVLLSDMRKDSHAEVIREVLKEYAPMLEKKVETIKVVGGGRKAFVTLEAASDVHAFVQFMDGFKLLGRTVHAEAAQAPGALPYSRAPAVPKASVPIAAEETPNEQDAESPENENFDAVAGRNAEKKFPMPDMFGGTASSEAPKPAPRAKQITGDRTSKYHYEDTGAKTVIIGNVSEETTVEALREHFEAAGRVLHAELLLNEHTKEPSGLAKVSYTIPAHARYAKENLDYSRLTGATIRVDRPGDSDARSFVPGAGASGAAVVEADDADEVEAADKARDEELEVAEVAKAYGVKNVGAFLRGARSESDEDDEDEDASPLSKEIKAATSKASVKKLREKSVADSTLKRERQVRSATRHEKDRLRTDKELRLSTGEAIEHKITEKKVAVKKVAAKKAVKTPMAGKKVKKNAK